MRNSEVGGNVPKLPAGSQGGRLSRFSRLIDSELGFDAVPASSLRLKHRGVRKIDQPLD